MFTRPDQTYDATDIDLDRLLSDAASPITRICRLIGENKKVLDIGAGNGILGQAIRTLHPSITIDGLEPNGYAASIAKPYYRNFYQGYFADHVSDILKQQYDYMILADVIEHIADPVAFLHEIVKCLPAQGKLILSIPNVAHGSNRIALMNGHFDYSDSGLLERTHLRFFTYHTIQQIVKTIDLHTEVIQYLQRSILLTDQLTRHCSIGLIPYLKMKSDPYARVYQFILVLSRSTCETKEETYGMNTGWVCDYFHRVRELRVRLTSYVRGNHKTEGIKKHT